MKPERIAEIAHGYADFCIDSDFYRIKIGIQDAIQESLDEETERFKSMERIFTQIAEYLGVEQYNVPGLLESIVELVEENRWFYPEKGEFPDDGEIVLCCYTDRNKPDMAIHDKDRSSFIDVCGHIHFFYSEVKCWRYTPVAPEE